MKLLRLQAARFADWRRTTHPIHRYTVDVTLGILVVLVLFVMTLQMFYPVDSTLPRARLAGERVGGQQLNEIALTITTRFSSSKLTVLAGNDKVTLGLGEIGAQPNVDQMVAELTRYPLEERLIPFSILFKQPQVDKLALRIDRTKLEAQAAVLAGRFTRPPHDAVIAIAGGGVKLEPAATGQSVKAEEMSRTLLASEYAPGTTSIKLQVAMIKPDRDEAVLQPLKAQAEGALRRHLVFSLPDGSVLAPDVVTKASWLKLEPEEPEGVPVLKLDEGEVAKFYTTVNAPFDVQPAPSQARTVDGREVGREPGAPGQRLNRRIFIDGAQSALLSDGPAVIRVPYEPINQVTIYNRDYTSSEEGLRAYTAYVAATEDISLVVRQLGGEGWTAEAAADKAMPSASTYKLFVAQKLLSSIAAGQTKWDERIGSLDVNGCLDQMIVVSLNACAETLLGQWGRASMNAHVYGLGFSRATNFSHPEAIQTSARDLADMVQGVYEGRLLKGTEREALLSRMGRQVFRYGIPTGTKAKTYDKVGYLWDYIHNAGIIEHPDGTYVLVVMTKRESYGRIAEITRDVERIMYSQGAN